MKKILPFFLLVLLLASCQKDPDMSKLSDDFVVFTVTTRMLISNPLQLSTSLIV